MGYLSSGSGLGNTLSILTNGDPLKGLLPSVSQQRKHEAQRGAVAQATKVAVEAARKQQLDLMHQAQAVAEQQTNMAMQQAIKDKVAADAEKPPATVDVTLTDTATESPTAQRAKRRKQFFNEGGYSPGVSL